MQSSFFRREILFLFVSALSAYYIAGIILQDGTNRPLSLAITMVSFIVIYYAIATVYSLIERKRN